MTDFTKEMDTLAAQLAKDANAADKAFGDRLDAFKALMPYYTLLFKERAKNPSDEDDLPNFDSFTKNIQEHGNGSDEPGIHGRPRRDGN
jgi:hypothetical protein